MIRKLLITLSSITLFVLSSTEVFAYSGDISINSKDISYSTANFLEGNPTRIYATAENNSTKDLLGLVRFYDNDKQFGADQAISIFAGKSDGVFIDWNPSYGNHKIAVKIFPWQPEIDDPNNNWIVDNVFVIQDTDHDGTPNATDNDDDGDKVVDTEDAFPLNPQEQYDTDGDNKGNNEDKDDDNDDVPDEFDDLPLDSTETIDTDKDGLGNIKDLDDDNDGIIDSDEENAGTNPTNPDTDEDKVKDKEDAFPVNPKEQYDTDKDSLGNNTDTDDDNDSIKDKEDPFPLNKGPVINLKDEPGIIGIFEKQNFDATPSYDEDGAVVTYQWEIDGKPVQEGNSLDYTFKTPGDHQVKLTVTDNSGESKTKEFQVSIINLGLYKQIGLTIVALLLALFIYFKYIHAAKKTSQIG
ncbi:MAG: PKD domain-containing protein [Patescibacteria group bacterium]